MDDTALWEAFSASTLPHEAWTHDAHLRVAWLFARRHSIDEAHLRMRVGIIRLNAFHGLVETPSRGYHETLTRVWLVLVAARLAVFPADSSLAFVEGSREWLGKDAVLRHYTKERVMSLRARATWVEPDVAPLPDVTRA